MPLRQTEYGGECPLEKFRIDIPGGAGSYTKDPLEACLSCNFGNMNGKGFNLETICQCPADMEWPEYDRLRKQYAKTTTTSKKGFWDFVKKNYKKTTLTN